MNKLRKFSMNNLLRFGIVFFLVCLGFRSSAQRLGTGINTGISINPDITIFITPPNVSSPTFTSVTDNSAVLGGNYSNGLTLGNTLTERGTAWKTGSGVIASDNPEVAPGVSIGVYTHMRTRLPSGTRIFFVAYAKYQTKIGSSAPTSTTILSTESSFFTLSAPPNGQPGSVFAATSTTNGAVEINLIFSAASTISAAGYAIYRKVGTVSPIINSSNLPNALAPPPSLTDGSVLVTTTTSDVASFTDSGLTPGTGYTYAFVPFGYNGANQETYNYLVGGYQWATAYTRSTEPTSQLTSISATAVRRDQIELTFPKIETSACGCNGYLILRKIDSAPNAASVVDGAAPSTIVHSSGIAYVTTITEPAQTTFRNIGLSAGIDYHYLIIPFNWNLVNDRTYNYKTDGSIATANALTPNFASTSTITLNGGMQGGGFGNGIDYINFPTPNPVVQLTDANSESLAQFSINDIGDDAESTTLTSITFSITNFENLGKVALFQISAALSPGDDPTYHNLGESEVSSGNVTFNGFSIMAPNGGTQAFQLRATFKTVVTDNQQINITVEAATASPSGSDFGSLNAGRAATSNANAINVRQSKLVFSPAAEINTRATQNFGPLTLRALDGNNNLDIDAASAVTLSALSTGGAVGTISSAPATGSNLVSGEITYNEISISQEDEFALTATSGSGSSTFTTSLQVKLTPRGVIITPGSLPKNASDPPLKLCYNGDFQSLSDIEIEEHSNSDFAVGTNVSLSLLLPPNFIFENSPATSTTPNTTTSGADPAAAISGITPLSYIATDGVNFNIVQFRYTASPTSLTEINKLIISGLKIKYIGTKDVENQIIQRFGGSAVQVGNADTDARVFGVLSAKNSSESIDFKVQKVSDEANINETDTQFQAIVTFVKLVPQGVSFEGVFTGGGVTGSTNKGYFFSPSSVGVGQYDITYTARESTGQRCNVSARKRFTVYQSEISGLLSSYCKNGDASGELSLATPGPQYGTTDDYQFRDLIYYNVVSREFFLLGTTTSAGKFSYDGTKNSFIFSAEPTDSSIPKGLVTIFDPKFAGHLEALEESTKLYIFYRMERKTDVTDVRLGRYTIVTLNAPPEVDLSILKTNFCNNEQAVALTGTPSPSNNTANDFFRNTGSPISVKKDGTTWKFHPEEFTDVAIGIPQTVNITYTYKDPVTTCSATSDPISVTVYAVPRNEIAVYSNVDVLCQGGTVPTFTAVTETEATYKWYKGDVFLRTGTTFTPSSNDLDVNSVGPTEFRVTQTVPSLELSPTFGCESPTANYEVRVNLKPSAPEVTAPPVCKNSTIANIGASKTQGALLRWYTDLSSLVAGDTIMTLNPASATASELSLSSATPGIFTRYVTQTLNSCKSDPREVKITINDLPEPRVDVIGVADLSKICKTSPAITLRAAPPGGVWSGSASPFRSDTGAESQLNPSTSDGLRAGQSYDLVYTSTDATTTCSNAYTLNFTILPSVDPKLSVSNACEGTPFTISNTSTIVSETASTTTIAGYGWSFLPGDQRPGDTRIGESGGTYKDPIVSLRTGSITYSMTTSDNCVVSKTQLINVGAVPDFNFNWSNPCQPDGVQFQAEIVGNVYNSSEVAYSWNFAKNGVLTQSGGNGSIKDPLVIYTNLGKDVAELTVAGTKPQQSGLGSANTVCTNTKSKNIFVVPQLQASATRPYNEYFETSNGNWVDAGANSSWSWITPPTAGQINANGPTENGTKIWKTHNATGNYNAQERSFILSPCINFSTGNFNKPVLSFDVIASTPSTSVDGLVVQWTNSGEIENDANWKVLGNTTSGKNWYNTTIVSSSPFSPPNGIANRPQWLRASYPLDEQIGLANGKVKFRIVFTSGLDGARGDNVGVAIDNVFIGDRTRLALIENFTNTSLKANPAAKEQNALFNTFGTTATEAVRLQYHTGFPGADPINAQFASVHNPRAFFYGIDNSPTARIDGAFESGPFANWARNLYTERILEPTSIQILQPLYTQDESGAVKIKPSFTTTSSLPKGTYIFTVLAEKTLNDPTYKGQNGEQSFSYVVKDIFPSPAGYRLPNDVVASSSAPATVVLPEFEWPDQGNLSTAGNGAIVIFLQNDAGPNAVKEVLQAYVDNNPLHPSVITAAEPGVASLLSFYPVPADKELFISLGEIAPITTPVILYDALGKVVHETTIDKGQQSKKMNTQEYAPGVYVIRLETDKGTVRKKVMVAH